MRFIVVNGRIPFRKTFCLWCCEEISSSYLRDVSTLLPYCDHECYALHHEAVSLIGRRARVAS
jgi:hypothetical protein